MKNAVVLLAIPMWGRLFSLHGTFSPAVCYLPSISRYRATASIPR